MCLASFNLKPAPCALAHCGSSPLSVSDALNAGGQRGTRMALLVMILGLVLFLGVHALTTRRELRARLIASWGEIGYKAGYALVALLGLVLIVRGFADYRAAGMIEV